MKILGIKVTHDAGIALVHDGKLIFSYELEKISNNQRHVDFRVDFSWIDNCLNEYGFSLDQIDTIVFDGWHKNKYDIADEGSKIKLTLNEYGWSNGFDSDTLAATKGEIESRKINYYSTMHVSGHIYSAYCSSPFAKNNENSFILIWDGAIFPRLLFFKAKENQIVDLGFLFPILGNFYAFFSNHFPPFDRDKIWDTKNENDHNKVHLSLAGKVMAYIGMGKTNRDLLSNFYKLFADIPNENKNKEPTEYRYTFLFQSILSNYSHLSSADILATMHSFIGNLLVNELRKAIRNASFVSDNLCYSGGCALNIKWNTQIRGSGLFNNIWIPPFPNDSGSAIGAACTMMMKLTNNKVLDWNVYSGPSLAAEIAPPLSKSRECCLSELACILATDEPVVFLEKRAEVGPRALGNRSILASPVSSMMKEVLNKIKQRESYRPVAPVCLEDEAPNIFDPGFPDPYMLFEHKIRKAWRNRIPAVEHLDGSARLQTINKQQNSTLFKLITEFYKITGIPLLCNTSANFRGKGFFPSVESALHWSKCKYVWSDGLLYTA